jgi:hypothetical protein
MVVTALAFSGTLTVAVGPPPLDEISGASFAVALIEVCAAKQSVIQKSRPGKNVRDKGARRRAMAQSQKIKMARRNHATA